MHKVGIFYLKDEIVAWDENVFLHDFCVISFELIFSVKNFLHLIGRSIELVHVEGK